MNGSVLIYVADTEEQVWQLVKDDIYTTTGVWDSDKVSSFCVLVPQATGFFSAKSQDRQGPYQSHRSGRFDGGSSS